MAKIIKFEKSKEKSLEEKFMETLSIDQLEMFGEIMILAEIDQTQREEKLINEICKLQSDLDKLKGEEL